MLESALDDVVLNTSLLDALPLDVGTATTPRRASRAAAIATIREAVTGEAA